MGSPAGQAIALTAGLRNRGHRTALIRGVEDPWEGSVDSVAEEAGVRPIRVAQLRREPGLDDLRALITTVRALRLLRPDVVHTHAAKGGAIGRVAALALGRRPLVVHTFHGHSLRSYFPVGRSAAYARVERALARRTTRLVAVSEEVRDDLVRLRVAPAARFEILPIGLDLEPFLSDGAQRAARRRSMRERLGIGSGERVVTLVARLVPIKRVDRFLRIARRLADVPEIRFLVVGDGHLREELRGAPEARGLGGRLVWAGFQADMAAVCAASDVVVLTSDNEGTPASLVEAQAAALPVVSTDVGGVRSTLVDGSTGYAVAPDDDAAFAAAVRSLLADDGLSRRLGEAGRAHVRDRFALDRLVTDVDALYARLAAERG